MQVEHVGRDVCYLAVFRRLLYADDSILSVVEAVVGAAAAYALLIGVECRQHEVVVALSAPSPVDMEEVGAGGVFVAVAHKLMSAARRHAAIDHRTVVGQLMVYQFHPFVVGIETARHELCGGVVVVICLEGCCHQVGI